MSVVRSSNDAFTYLVLPDSWNCIATAVTRANRKHRMPDRLVVFPAEAPIGFALCNPEYRAFASMMAGPDSTSP